MAKRTPTADKQIIQYSDGTYYVRVGDRERSLKTKDFSQALKRKKVAIDKLDQTGENSSRLRVGDVWADYEKFREASLETKFAKAVISNQAQRRRRMISPGTFREIKNLWRLHLGPFWAQVRLDKINEEKWSEYTDQSLVIDLANHRKVLRGFLKWCKTRLYIKYVPDMTIPAVDRRERRVLKPHEIRAIFEHARGSCLLFVSCYLFMGMRRKEIMTLQWADIHLSEGYLVLRRSEVKTRRGRPLPLNSFVATLLWARQEAQRVAGVTTEFVFPNAKTPKKHADVSGLKTAWNTVMRKCEFESGYITPHDLRATFEAYAHKDTTFTDTQKEKFAGAAIDVQKKTYVRFDADDIRGLEAVVRVDGLDSILKQKLISTGKQRGKQNEESVH
jgi:integrase